MELISLTSDEQQNTLLLSGNFILIVTFVDTQLPKLTR
jgi:hypothetical protein